MNRITLCLILFLSFQGNSQSMRDMIDQIFESQKEMMDQMMDDDFIDSMDSLGTIDINQSQGVKIDSAIIKENGKTYEVVTIVAEGDINRFDIKVDQMIQFTVTSTQTQKDKNRSFTSSSSSSQIIPIPESGVYKPSKTKKSQNSASLYFEVPEGKIASEYGRSSFPKSLFNNRARSFDPGPNEEEDKAIVVPQRKI